MKRFITIAGLVAAVGVSTAAPTAQTADPFVGTWKLNTAKSKFDPGPAPRSMTATFTSTGNTATAAIAIVASDSTPSNWSYTATIDGKDYPLQGNPEADTISAKRVNARSVETTFKKAGKVTAVNTRTVSADGKTMTVTTKGTNAQGQPMNNVQVFDRS